MLNKTKIIATIGPSSNTRSVLLKLILSGMNAARLNFSHGTYEEHGNVINMIRSVSREINKPVAIIIDLQGPKIRTGKLKEGKPVVLKKNSQIKITTENLLGTAEIISTTYKGLVKDVKKGDKILVDDGLMELRVLSKKQDTVTCKVVNGGILKEHKGINLPNVKISTPSLTEKDKKDLNFAIKTEVDYVALSFVRKADDLKNIKAILKKQGSTIPVIAKIEKPEAVENLDAILKITDAVMVARGDLGVELMPEKVPAIQKKIIRAAILANKPVITATQMLETMTVNPIPTRAEASDVANAIYDGTDAVMLSGETAAGKHPVKVVQMMSKIIAETEKSPFMKYNIWHELTGKEIITQAVAQASVLISDRTKAKAIISFSVSGKTSKLISKHRPTIPVYSFSPSRKTYNHMSILWGVYPLFIPEVKDAKLIIEAGERIILDKKLVRKDDMVVILTGLALKSGSTNLIKIHRIGHED